MIVVLVITLIFRPVWIAVFFKYYRSWKKASVSRVPVAIKELVGMMIHKDSERIHSQRAIAFFKSEVSLDDLCVHFMRGGNLDLFLEGLLKAKFKKLDLSF